MSDNKDTEYSELVAQCRGQHRIDLSVILPLLGQAADAIESLQSALEAGRAAAPVQEPIAFAQDGNLFWCGNPVEKRSFTGSLYTHPAPLLHLSDEQIKAEVAKQLAEGADDMHKPITGVIVATIRALLEQTNSTEGKQL